MHEVQATRPANHPAHLPWGLNLRQAAACLGVSVGFMRGLVARGEIAALINPSGARTKVTVMESDLMEYIRRHRRPATGERG